MPLTRNAATLAVTAVFAIPGVLRAQDPDPAGRRSTVTSYVGADYQYAYFHGDIDPWHLTSVTLGRRGERGSFIARGNYASRFDTDGFQVELDAYPRLNGRMYAYVNAGYSGTDLFPEWRSGGELFVSLPRAWEASAGYRQLRFGGPPVTLFTGAVGKYIGNSWISARPYVRVKETGTSASVGVTARKYFADGDNYIGARASAGSSPSDRVDASQLARNGSWSAGVHGSRTLRARLFGTWSLGVEREELSATVTRKRVDASLGFRREF